MSNMDPTLFHIKSKNAVASGVKTDDGFLVQAGSTACKEIVPSGVDSVTPIRKQLLSEGVMVEEGDVLRFTTDHVFDSPSGAAAAVMGRTANGWIEWKQADGQTLSQAMRVFHDDGKPIFDDEMRKRIAETFQELMDDGKLPTRQKLDQEYALFRERFGPTVLRSLDGEALLNLMHGGGGDSLVYWLEFKNDEEFESRRYGSIAGGSALKFRVFRRKETGNWQAGGKKGNKPTDITTDEAIEYARSHRDQLLRGVELLEALPTDASDDDYAQLQDQMDELAPDVSRLAWGHKYFSLLFPDKIDNYHSPAWQRFALIKMLQLPPEGDGRYLCAGRFVKASREAAISMVHLDSVLVAIYGTRHRYWRVGTTSGKTTESYWSMMRDRSCVAIGWSATGDLSWVTATQESRASLKRRLDSTHLNFHPTALGQATSQITHFIADISEGDVVIAANGETILGVGKIVGGYHFEPEFEFPHHRDVEWLSLGEWKMPFPKEGLQSTVREIRKHNENLLAIEQQLRSGTKVRPPNGDTPPSLGPIRPTRLKGIAGRIQSILERKGQVILYGPPGTGKTYWAEKTANELAVRSAFGRSFDDLEPAEVGTILGHRDTAGLVRICCFHPAYGYEDFLEGYRPRTVDGQMSFELRDGVFKRMCRDALSDPSRNYYLIVDEINRGDIPRIFGELLTTLEKDKREKRIILPVSQEIFTVPRNVYLIGTMNTADRSISLLDAALRRRFGFVEMMPDGAVLKDSSVAGIPLKAWLEALNAHIREHVGRDARNLQIGHSYLMTSGSSLKDLAALKRAIRDDIIPLLEEYCYEDYGTLAKILGEQLVDISSARIRQELFDDGREDDFVQGLLAPFADISTSTEAIASEESHIAAEEEDDDEEMDEP